MSDSVDVPRPAMAGQVGAIDLDESDVRLHRLSADEFDVQLGLLVERSLMVAATTVKHLQEATERTEFEEELSASVILELLSLLLNEPTEVKVRYLDALLAASHSEYMNAVLGIGIVQDYINRAVTAEEIELLGAAAADNPSLLDAIRTASRYSSMPDNVAVAMREAFG